MTSAVPCDWLGPVIYDMNYDNHDVSLLLSLAAASPAARYNKLLSLITALCSAMITPPPQEEFYLRKNMDLSSFWRQNETDNILCPDI